MIRRMALAGKRGGDRTTQLETVRLELPVGDGHSAGG